VTFLGREIVLWRHERTTWNQGGRFQGRTDMPLNQRGPPEALAATDALAKHCPTVLLTSDAARAVGTARLLADFCRSSPSPTRGCARPTSVPGRV
jgi:broad specificity phosphatase PhoE